MPFVFPTTNLDVSGKTLIVPIVSTANISQLAVDLLIASLSLRRVAIIDPSYFIPVVAGRDDGEAGVTTPLELYGRDQLDIVVLQQRSPVLKSKKQEFIDALLGYIQSSGISSVLFLSGVELSNRTDAQMNTPIYQLQAPNAPSTASTPLHRLSALPIPTYSSPVPQNPQAVQNDQDVPFIPGGGLTRRILSSLSSTWSIPTAALLQFVVEGDNRADANLLAAVVAKVVGVDSEIQEWKQPKSWQQGLFGAPTDPTLYG